MAETVVDANMHDVYDDSDKGNVINYVIPSYVVKYLVMLHSYPSLCPRAKEVSKQGGAYEI